MKKWNKFVALFAFVTLCASLSLPVYASESTKNIADEIDIRTANENVIISAPMSADEMIQLMSQNLEISTADAREQLLGTSADSYSNSSSRSIKYRTLSAKLDVSAYYKPSIEFYMKTDETFAYWAIVEILNVQLNRNSQEPGFPVSSKQFQGDIYTNLEASYILFYRISGDFYNNGTMTGGGSVSIPVGGNATVGFQISGSSNHFRYFYDEQRMQTQH